MDTIWSLFSIRYPVSLQYHLGLGKTIACIKIVVTVLCLPMVEDLRSELYGGSNLSELIQGGGTPQNTKTETLSHIGIKRFEIGDPGEYEYFSPQQTGQMLTELHYGPSKKLVDVIYVHESGKQAIGVLRVTNEMCEGHFDSGPVMRGVDQMEAGGQVLLLLKKLSGELPESISPRLTEMNNVRFTGAAIPGMLLNIAVLANPEVPIGGLVKITNGSNEISEGELRGVTIKQKISDRLLEMARRGIQEPTFRIR